MSDPCAGGACLTPAAFFEGGAPQWQPQLLRPHEAEGLIRGVPAKDPHFLWNPQACLAARDTCLVVSVGSNGEFGFEEEVHRLAPGCAVHTVDGTLGPAQIRRAPSFVSLHLANLCSPTSGKCVTKDIGAQIGGARAAIARRGVQLSDLFAGRRIDVLKIDCESCEYDTVSEWFASGICIDQIAIELHVQYICKGCDTTNNVRRAHALLAELHARGYSVFHHTRGAHKNNPGMREISLIRRTPCKRFDCHSDLWAVECPK